MAITQTGTKLDFGFSNTNATGTVSSTITVPSDAEIVVVGWNGWTNDWNVHSAMTFTKGGVDTPMVWIGYGDLSIPWKTSLFYLVLPDTGTNKTLKWSWTTNTAESINIFSVTFWKGINTANPVRDSGGRNLDAGVFPVNTYNPIAVQNGDKVVAFAGYYHAPADQAGAITGWNNLTQLGTKVTGIAYNESAWATADPTSSSMLTVGVTSCPNSSGLGINAIVLVPAGGTIDSIVRFGTQIEVWINDTSATGTCEPPIVVPPGTEIMLVGLAGYHGINNGHTTLTMTKGGTDTAMTKISNADGPNYNAVMWYMAAPDIGQGKRLKWSWNGGSADSVARMSVTFLKGVDTASPVRDTDGAIGVGWPRNTPTLTCVSGDKVVVFAGFYRGNSDDAGDVTAWNNATGWGHFVNFNACCLAWASGLPTADTSVGVQSCTGSEGGVLAIVLKPSGVAPPAATSKPYLYRPLRFVQRRRF